jgi:hypothetical protein
MDAFFSAFVRDPKGPQSGPIQNAAPNAAKSNLD